MVLVMATSLVAGGKRDVARSKGESILLGWARHNDGNPATEPVAMAFWSRSAARRCQLEWPGHGSTRRSRLQKLRKFEPFRASWMLD